MLTLARLGGFEWTESQGLVTMARRHAPAIAVLVALTVVMCRNLVFSDEFPGGWDVASMTYPITYFARTDAHLSLWEDSVTGYVTPIGLFHLLSFPADLLDNPAFVARAVLILAVLAAALLMYLFAFVTTRRVLASVLSGIIFTTSPWFVANTADGHGYLIIGYALAPFLFLLVDRGLQKVTWFRVLALGVALGVLPYLRLDPVVYVCPFIGLFALWHVVMARRQWRVALKDVFRLLLPAAVLGALLSASVWLPMVRTGTAHAAGHFSLAQITNDTLSFWPSLKGQGLIYSYVFWLGGTSHYTHQFLPPLLYGILLFLTPALAFAQLRLRMNRRVGFFLMAAVLSVFLAKGPWPPLGEVYELLWQYVPFVNRLHVANRWLMVAWVSYAFLVGLTLDGVYEASKRVLSGVRRPTLRRVLSAAPLVALLVGCTVGVSYVFTDGYQTGQFPQEEVAPHQWLGENGGDGRFLVVPFEERRAFGPGGWIEHDLGFTGGMFSGRPSFDEPSFSGYASDFFVWAQDLVEERADNLAKILGAYDTRYVVVQGYSGNALPRHPLLHKETSPVSVELEYWEHQYFDELPDLRAVFQGPQPEYTMQVGVRHERELTYRQREPRLWPLKPLRHSVIYENDQWVPRAFVPERRMLIVGGLDSLQTVAGWDEFSFRDWDVRFASRAFDDLGPEGLMEVLSGTDLLVLKNSELLDLVMMIAGSARADLDTLAGDPEAQWAVENSASYDSEDRTVLGARTNHATATLEIDLAGGEPGQEYELWARVFYGPRSSLIHFEVDGREIGSLLPQSRQNMGFVWEKVGRVSLDPGRSQVSFTALAAFLPFETRVDEVALVKAGDLRQAAELLTDIVKGHGVQVVSLQDTDSLWWPHGSSTQLSRFGQFVLRMDSPEDAGIREVRFGGEADPPRFYPGGRFLVRNARPAGGYAPILELEFAQPRDWSNSAYLRLDFKGVGKGDEVRVWLGAGGSGEVTYSFEDLSSVWETIHIPLADPAATVGSMQWNQVTSLAIDTSAQVLDEGMGLGQIAVLRDRLSLEGLGAAMGMKTVALSLIDPAPESLAALLSGSGERPAEILRLNQVSPYLYRLGVDAKGPYTLVVSNTYHPLWRLTVDGREIRPSPAYYFVSAYDIQKTGQCDLTLEFVGQRYQWLAFAVSGLTLAAICVAAAYVLLRARRMEVSS